MRIVKYIFLLSSLIFAFSACEKEDDTGNKPRQYDHSLIMSRGSGAKLVLTNPVDGKDLYVNVPSPAVEDVKSLKAGYMCKNAVFVAKTYLSKYTMSIYTCDAKTGAGTKAITENDLYVFQDINVSQTEPKIVFTGKPNDNPQYKSVYTINEDGSRLSHISEPLEHIDGPGGTFELQPASFPAFSPDGSKIAFDVLALNYPKHDTYYEFIVIMNSDGGNKEVFYSEPGKNIAYYDLCWTQDGNFLLFIRMSVDDDSFHRRVKVFNINSRKVNDITASLEINGDQVNDVCTSPNADKIVFNQRLGGGSDLFIAEYEIHDDLLTIKGLPLKSTDRENSKYSYYTPSWQFWDEK